MASTPEELEAHFHVSQLKIPFRSDNKIEKLFGMIFIIRYSF
jgi:hypothetical protein